MPASLHLRRLADVVRYLNAFGLRIGLANYLRARRRSGVVRIRDHAGGRTMFLRAGMTDLYTFEEIFLDQIYRAELPRPPAVIVDAGANVGYACLWFRRRYPHARLIAVEPDRDNLALMHRNLAGLDKVTVVEAALWPRPARLCFRDPHAGKDAMQVTDEIPVESGRPCDNGITAITVDDICRRFGLERIDLLKIDIEGAEKDLFSGDTAWLAQVSAIVIELHERLRPGCALAFYQAMADHGFRAVADGGVVWMINPAHFP